MTMTKISQDLNLSERSSQLKHARFRLDCIDVWLQFAFHSKQDVRNSDTILRWIGDQLVQWVELWKRINRQVNGFHSIFSIVSSTLFSIALTSFSLRKDDGIMSLDSTIYNMFVGPLSFFILSSEFDSTSLSSSAFKTWSKFLLLENASIGSTDELEKVLLWANDYLSSKSVISSFDTLTDHVLQFLFSVATNRNHFDALIRSKHITTLAFFLKNILLSKDLNSHKDKYLKRKLILKILEMIASFTKWFVKGGLGTERVDSQVFSRQIKSFLMLHEEFLIPSLLLTDDTNSKWIDLTSFSARTCSAISRIILNVSYKIFSFPLRFINFLSLRSWMPGFI